MRSIRHYWKRFSSTFCKTRRSMDKWHTVTKYKVLGFTVYKEVQTATMVVRTYAKLFRRTGNPPLQMKDDDYALLDLPIKQDAPLVSIIVPVHNHKPYLGVRLDSIYEQTYPHYEVILLDNASTDGSREILQKYAAAHPGNTRLVECETAIESTSRLWNKGIELAGGDYIWMAVADAYCDADFLEKVLVGLEHQSVMFSFSQTIFGNEGSPMDNPSASYLMPAYTFSKRGFTDYSLIPGMGSVVFRNVGPLAEGMEFGNFRDFLRWLMRGGSVYYTAGTHSYTSHGRKTLLEHAKAAEQADTPHKPRIGICIYSMLQGGGEIFPIHLANELRREGYPVTCIDFRSIGHDPVIRKMLHRDVPLVELEHRQYLRQLVEAFGIEVMHSHETSVDCAVGEALADKNLRCRQVITLHGAYDCLLQPMLDRALDTVAKSCSCFVYISDKNLKPFKALLPSLRFKKIGNGLPVIPITPHKRADFGIEETAFCLTLVSRSLFEKGWLEAIEAVKRANQYSPRPIHLLLIGDGECYDYLKLFDFPPYIHMLGRKGDVRNYFAMSDAGLLPSYFKGESFPLVIIEALMSGVPMIASDIGEVRHMLSDGEGHEAGIVFELEEERVSVSTLSKIILRLASDHALYESLKREVPLFVERFSITTVARQYTEVYKEVLSSNP